MKLVSWPPVYSLAETPQFAPSPRLWAYIRERYWSAKIDDPFVTPWLLYSDTDYLTEDPYYKKTYKKIFMSPIGQIGAKRLKIGIFAVSSSKDEKPEEKTCIPPNLSEVIF